MGVDPGREHGTGLCKVREIRSCSSTGEKKLDMESERTLTGEGPGNGEKAARAPFTTLLLPSQAASLPCLCSRLLKKGGMPFPQLSSSSCRCSAGPGARLETAGWSWLQAGVGIDRCSDPRGSAALGVCICKCWSGPCRPTAGPSPWPEPRTARGAAAKPSNDWGVGLIVGIWQAALLGVLVLLLLVLVLVLLPRLRGVVELVLAVLQVLVVACNSCSEQVLGPWRPRATRP